MTNYLTMEKCQKKASKKTVFKKAVDNDKIINTRVSPEDWENVQFLYHDIQYGDVFLAWDYDPEERTIYFGEKGDEFE